MRDRTEGDDVGVISQAVLMPANTAAGGGGTGRTEVPSLTLTRASFPRRGERDMNVSLSL